MQAARETVGWKVLKVLKCKENIKIWNNGHDVFIAYSADEAMEMAGKWSHSTVEEYAEETGHQGFESVDMDEKISISELDAFDGEPTTMTAEEWIKWNGHGYLCSYDW